MLMHLRKKLERLEANRDDYVEIEAMGSGDSYRVMVDFAEQLTNATLQDALFPSTEQTWSV